jgi:hypothetical protein
MIQPPLTYDEIVESLYNFDRATLRRIAYEALLVSDGPNKVEGDATDSAIEVLTTNVVPLSPLFVIYDKEGQLVG